MRLEAEANKENNRKTETLSTACYIFIVQGLTLQLMRPQATTNLTSTP